jgi:hypothetical protein
MDSHLIHYWHWRMKLYTPAHQPLQRNNPAEQFILELSDRGSLWYDLRVAEMSGDDYVFAPDAVCQQLCTIGTITEFLTNVQTILGSPKARTQLVNYWHDRHRAQHFEKYCVEWADGIPLSWKKEPLNGSPQFDFIKTLFEHSEKLIL